MKVLIVGAGGQGAPCASILSRDAEVEEIRLADININVAERVREKIGSDKIKAVYADASDVRQLTQAAQGVDVVFDLVTPVFFTNVMEAALAAGAHYVNTAWEEYLFENYEADDVQLGGRLKYDDEFKAKGLTAILGCGMTSGYASNVLIRLYADKMDQIESVKIRLAKKDTSITDEEEILYPWNPGWNPRQALLDFVVPAYKFEEGKFIPMDKPFAEPEMWEFPAPIGRTLVSHHAHEEPFSIPHLLVKKGLKYCDFKYYVNKQIAPIVQMGLASEEEKEINGMKIKPLDFVLSMVPPPGDAFFQEDPSQFDYLDRTKLVSIVFEMKGKKDGKDRTYLVHVPSMVTPRAKMYELYGTSLINVALPAVIGGKMAAEGTVKGVVHPHDLDPDRFIELMRKTGYPNRWEETVIE